MAQDIFNGSNLPRTCLAIFRSKYNRSRPRVRKVYRYSGYLTIRVNHPIFFLRDQPFFCQSVVIVRFWSSESCFVQHHTKVGRWSHPCTPYSFSAGRNSTWVKRIRYTNLPIGSYATCIFAHTICLFGHSRRHSPITAPFRRF